MTPEDALYQHLLEAQHMPLASNVPVERQCGTCGEIKTGMIYNMVRLIWECPKSFPCEAIGIEIEQTDISEIKEPVLVMEMV